MFNITHRDIPNAGLLPLLFLVGFLILFPTHTAWSATVVGRLPVALTVPVKAPVKAIRKKAEARLKIPSIKVNAVIRDMGVTAEGVMAVPANRSDVGWFSSGTRPGDIGSAVIGGHNRWADRNAVFLHLDKLKIGDVMSIVDAKGITRNFVVRETKTYAATDFDNGIFLSVSGVHLNLITCSGVRDPITKNYPTRLVVFTDAI